MTPKLSTDQDASKPQNENSDNSIEFDDHLYLGNQLNKSKTFSRQMTSQK